MRNSARVLLALVIILPGPARAQSVAASIRAPAVVAPAAGAAAFGVLPILSAAQNLLPALPAPAPGLRAFAAPEIAPAAHAAAIATRPSAAKPPRTALEGLKTELDAPRPEPSDLAGSREQAARSFDAKLGAEPLAADALASDSAPAAAGDPGRRSSTLKAAPTARSESRRRNTAVSPSLREAADLIRSRPAFNPGWLGVALATGLLLLVPMRGKTAFHEFGHYAAARLMGIRPSEVRFSIPRSEDSDMNGYVRHAYTTPRKQIPVSLAGPLFSWLYLGGILAAFVPVVAGAFHAHVLLGLAAFGVLSADAIFGLIGALTGGGSDLARAYDAWRERPGSPLRRVRWTQAELDLIGKLKTRHGSTRPEILRKAWTLLQLLSGLAQDGAVELHAKDRSVKVLLKSPGGDQKPVPPQSADGPPRTPKTAESIVLAFDEPALRAIEAVKNRLGLGWTEQVLWRALVLLDIVDQYTDENGTLSVTAGDRRMDVLMR